MKADYKIMYKKNADGVWSYDEVFGETYARSEANRLWKEGYIQVELYSRVRGGWQLVKSVKQNEKVSEAKQRAHFAELLKKAQYATMNAE